MLNIAVKAARAAGSIINRAALDLEVVGVGTKGPNDYVSKVDQAAETAIIDVLHEAYPGHGILAEESGRARGAKDSEYTWIIDPLDGTTNFLHGFPVYAVSIALAHRGVVQQAVVYDPTRNDLFFASRGRGAFLNDRRLRVSLAPCTRVIEQRDAEAQAYAEATPAAVGHDADPVRAQAQTVAAPARKAPVRIRKATGPAGDDAAM